MTIDTPIKSNKIIVSLYILFCVIVIIEAFRFAFSVNHEVVEGITFFKPWIWMYGAFLIACGLGLLWYVCILFNKRTLAQIVVCLVFCTWYFVFFESDLTIDDGGIVLKYLDNAKKGYFFTYNIGDGPVWGISSFFHGLLCTLLAMFTPLSSFQSLMCANFIGLFFLSYALFCFVSNYSKDSVLQYIYWLSGMLLSYRLMVCSKQGLETGLHVGLLFYTFHLFFNRDKKTSALILAWVLCLISKLDSTPIVCIMGLWFLIENRTRLMRFDKKLYLSIFIYGIAPGILWLIISAVLFGGPVPQTAIAKQFSQHTFGPGFRFIQIFFENRPKLWALVAICIAMGFISRYILKKKNNVTYRDDMYFLPIISLFGYFLLYYFYNPREAMIWYYVIPEMLFIYIISYNINLCLEMLVQKMPGIERYKQAIVVFVFLSFFVFYSNKTAKEIGVFWYTRTVQEKTFKEVGEYIHIHADPSDTLFCGHGYPARESDLYNVDAAGLNFTGTTDLNFIYIDILKKYQPDWIATIIPFKDLCNGNIDDTEWINSKYTLVKIYPIDYRAEMLQFPFVINYEIWKKNDQGR